LPHIRRRSGIGEAHAGRVERGQSLVEFALVLPMLLVLLLGIADFGRVFSAGITMEALTRNSAEAAAQEYLQLRRATPGSEPTTAAYDAVIARAQTVACDESKVLPNHAGAGVACEMPIVAACVHDEWGDHCASPTATPPDQGQCGEISATPVAMAAPAGGLPYVEVRACYRFSTLVNVSNLRLPLGWSLTLGEIWLQRDRSFTVADY
jgi:Flp pilus assembly protein TadG